MSIKNFAECVTIQTNRIIRRRRNHATIGLASAVKRYLRTLVNERSNPYSDPRHDYRELSALVFDRAYDRVKQLDNFVREGDFDPSDLSDATRTAYRSTDWYVPEIS